ncbi:MAG: DUF1932 domain-containing protein [Acidimicrobiales bacterium]
MARIGILHPGQMGVSIAASAIVAGNEEWVGAGRSADTVERAESVGLRDVGSVEALASEAELIVSVAPPAAALDVARSVAATEFAGLFLDANAVSPATATQVGDVVESGDAMAVDGGIIGPPAWHVGSTRLYVAGAPAAAVAELLNGGPLEVVALDTPYGSASALKMAYAGWSKGSAALLLAMAAYAEDSGVSDALADEWERSQPGLVERAASTAAGTAPKAWRFVGEMEEIAATMGDSALPAGFHAAAAVVYERMAGFKDASSPATLNDVTAALLNPKLRVGSDPSALVARGL